MNITTVRMDSKQDFPTIKCRIRAGENEEGKIHLQIVLPHVEEILNQRFDSWEDFAKQVSEVIQNFKKRHE